MHSGSNIRSTLTSLWFRLITLGIAALAFAEVLQLAEGQAHGWLFYLTPAEVAFEVLVRLSAAALAGIALGTIVTVAVAPFFFYFKSSRERTADWLTKLAVVLVVFFVGRFALATMIDVSYHRYIHSSVIDSVLFAAFYLSFAVGLCIPRSRRQVMTSLDGFLGEKMTRRTAIATVAGAAALVATEYGFARSIPKVRAALAPQRPKSNFLMVTFDALSAEDISIYGYRLPTTPNLDAFARKGTVFKNFYSGSSFTTPSIATMLLGMYPSESRVHQLYGLVRAEDARKSLPHVMRAAGYATGAFFSNAWGYSGVEGLEHEYDFISRPAFEPGGLQSLWDATTPLHQDSGIGSRNDEYLDLAKVWNSVGRLPNDLPFRFRAVASFKQARDLLAKLPEGFFLWVHVMTPHEPYLPDAEDEGRFISHDERRTLRRDDTTKWELLYPPDQQSRLDQHRLVYDEFIATADRAFGAFMSELEAEGKLQNTTVIISADHGESFEGRVYRHRTPYLTRPVIHIPLIIRTPGQQQGRTIAFTADQTSLAPTILELAGATKPDSMRGTSLVGWLNRDGRGEGEGTAFCQYLERNSIFKPVRHGTAGVIDGKSQYQYVYYLDTQKGELRPLNEAQIWNLDRTADNLALAAQLHATLHARFPDFIPQQS